MAVRLAGREFAFGWNELTGAIGDSATVLPLIVAIAVLTDLSLAVMLVWFGVFQVVSGVYFDVPMSVEPMKAVAAVVIAGGLTTGEFLLTGLLVSLVLLAIGTTRTLTRVTRYVDTAVMRGIQFGVALVLLEVGLGLGVDDPLLAGVGLGVVAVVIALGYWNASALVVLGMGAILAILTNGIPSPELPAAPTVYVGSTGDLTRATLEATVAQIAMTIGNATLATSILLADYFDRQVSPDELSVSMGLMNLVAVPFGAAPMCHGSGGVAGKYAFGARTAGANVILGGGYLLISILAVGVVAAFPIAMLGVILALVGLQLGQTSLLHTERYVPVILIGVVGLVVNLGVAFVVGVIGMLVQRRLSGVLHRFWGSP